MAIERRVVEASALRAFFQEYWQQLTELLGTDADGKISDEYDAKHTGDAVDLFVDGTDARIRAIHNYKKELRSGVRGLLEHICGIVDRLPGAVTLSQHNFVYDPQIRHFLNGMNELLRLCGESSEVSEYITTHPVATDEPVFALLSMTCEEKESFGNELKGEILHRDVRQTSVVITNHKFLILADSEDAIRQNLKRILFESVVDYLRLQLTIRRRNELKAKADGGNPVTGKIYNLNNPYEYLRCLVELLESPPNLICLEEDRIRVNNMGIKSEQKHEAEGTNLKLQNLRVGNEYPHLLLITEIPGGSLIAGDGL